jgi:hypothetical protein
MHANWRLSTLDQRGIRRIAITRTRCHPETRATTSHAS